MVSNIQTGETIFSWTITNGTCEDANNLVVTNSELIVADAGENDELCNISNFQLNADNPSPGVGAWQILSGNCNIDDTADPNATISNILPQTTNILQWNVINGTCTSFDIIEITNYALETSVTGDDISDCEITQVQLSANTPSSGVGVWTCSDLGVNFDNATLNNAMVSNIQTGETTFTWTITNGTCENTDELILINGTSVIAYAGKEAGICDENVYQLQADNPETGIGVWTTDSGSDIYDINSPSTFVTEINQEVNIFIWTITNGTCEESVDSVIIKRNVSQSVYAGDDMSICDTNNHQLSADLPTQGIGEWQCDNEDITFVDVNNANSKIYNLPVGETFFTWNVTNGKCLNSDIVSIQHDTTILATTAEDDELCLEEEYTLQANAVTNGNGSWSCSDADVVFSNYNNNQTVITNLNEGTTTFVWEVVNGECVSSDEFQLSLLPIPIFELGEDIELIEGETVILDAGFNADATYLWYPQNETTQTIEVSAEAVYIATVTKVCSYNDSIEVYFAEEELIIQNAFTPNGDGANDTWFIPVLSNKLETTFHVFDKFGATIAYYTQEEMPYGWDGNRNGNPVFSDTYWYIITLEDGTKKTGSVTIKR